MSRRRRAARRRYILAWVALLALCAATFATRVWQQRAAAAHSEALGKARAEAERRAKAAPSRVPDAFARSRAAWKDGTGPAPTTQVIAPLIGASEALHQIPAGGFASFPWRDPESGMTWQLTFEDDVWVHYEPKGYDPGSRVPAAPPTPWLMQPFDPAVIMAFDDAVIAAVKRTPVTLAVLAAAALATLPLRRAAFVPHLLLAAVLLNVFARTLPTDYHARWAGLFLSDQGQALLLATGLALVGLWFHHRPRKIVTPTCDECGYDLTGNLSGICPECGTPATSTAPVTEPAPP